MRKAPNSEHGNTADKNFTQKQPKEIESHVFQRLNWIMFFVKNITKKYPRGQLWLPQKLLLAQIE